MFDLEKEFYLRQYIFGNYLKIKRLLKQEDTKKAIRGKSIKETMAVLRENKL